MILILQKTFIPEMKELGGKNEASTCISIEMENAIYDLYSDLKKNS